MCEGRKGNTEIAGGRKSDRTNGIITYFTERNHYRDFAEADYGLFSVPVFFGGRGINPNTEIHAISRGIYDVKGCPDYGILDEEIERVLCEAPNAYIFPRVNVMMPEWWCNENPLECNDTQNRESFFHRSFAQMQRICSVR